MKNKDIYKQLTASSPTHQRRASSASFETIMEDEEEQVTPKTPEEERDETIRSLRQSRLNARRDERPPSAKSAGKAYVGDNQPQNALPPRLESTPEHDEEESVSSRTSSPKKP